MLREDLPAVGSFSQPVVVFTPVAERGGVLGLVVPAPLIGHSVDIILGRGVNANEARANMALLDNLQLINIVEEGCEGKLLLPNAILRVDIKVAILNRGKQKVCQQLIINVHRRFQTGL